MHKNLYTLNLRSPGQLRPLIDQISSKPHCNEKQLENRGEFHFRCFLNWSRQLGPILCLFVQTGSQCSKAAPAACPNCTSEPVCLWGWGDTFGEWMLKSHSFVLLYLFIEVLHPCHSLPEGSPWINHNWACAVVTRTGTPESPKRLWDRPASLPAPLVYSRNDTNVP